MSVWWLIGAAFGGAFLLLAASLAYALERAHRKRWQRRARRAGYIDLTPPRFGDTPAGRERPKVKGPVW